MKKNEIVLFNTEDNEVKLEVPVNGETVWLSRKQMAELFGRDVKTIGKHINNALHEELDNSTVANFATVQMEGYREVVRDIQYYNLDVIISVGYRVKSKRGVEFRKWANSVLKQYILQGYAVNSSRIAQLGEVIRVMKRTENTLDSRQVLSVIEKYSKALNMLDSYDHQNMNRPKGSNDTYRLTYEECINVISHMRFGDESALFGREKDDSFKGSIGNIYQSFGGQELYPSLEEKADFFLLPCPGLVELIEQGKTDCPETEGYLRQTLASYLDAPPDAVVLGCTHFPFVKPLLQKLFGEKVRFFDGAEGTARQLHRRLEESELLSARTAEGSLRLESSDPSGQAVRLMQTLLNRLV